MKRALLMETSPVDSSPLATDASWLAPHRQAAFAAFQKLGFPTPKQETWRYTDLSTLARTPFRLSTSADIHGVAKADLEPHLLPGHEAPTLVFINGHYAPHLSAIEGLPDKLTVGTFADNPEAAREALEPYLAQLADYQTHPFAALNTAHLYDGAYLLVPQDLVVDSPLHLLHLTTNSDSAVGTVSHPRTLVVAGESSQLTLTEDFAGGNGKACLTNPVTEIVVRAKAHLNYYRLQRQATSTFHTSTLAVRQAPDSSFASLTLDLGGGLVRNDLSVALQGQSAQAQLLGLSLTEGNQHVDNHTFVDHAVAHTASHQLYKSILDGESTGAFRGRIRVRPGAQKTDALQTNRNLLLSDRALVNTRPQLEIYANDVRCTHGATISRLEEQALFYLRSRGIDKGCASCLLVYAFGSQVLEQLKAEKLRRAYQQLLLQRLPQVCHLLEEP